jgi:membrane dipeptidase
MTNQAAPNHNEFPIIDGHNDTLIGLTRPRNGQQRHFLQRNESGHLDLPRAREGGFAGGFFAAFVSTPNEKTNEDRLTITDKGFIFEMDEPIDQPYALQETIAFMSTLFRLESESAGQVKVVRTVNELETCLHNGTLAAILHMEGAEAIDTELNTLHVLYAAGLRSLGPVWSRPNDFGYGVPFSFPSSPDTGPGLTDAGKALVKECNRLGIMIDLAHLNEKGFWDVAKCSDAPLVSTHTAVEAICPAARNLTDRQIDAVGESGGVIGVNFFVGNLREDGKWERDMPLTQLVRHVDYIANRIGIDHVAFGSDFDGATMADDLSDVTRLPNLIATLRSAGYDDASLRKITHENWLRVLRQTWR